MAPETPLTSRKGTDVSPSISGVISAPPAPSPVPPRAESVAGPMSDEGDTPAEKRQRLADVSGFPPRNVPLPIGLSLEDICRNYPNHLIGDGLNPFIGVMNAREIYQLMPEVAKRKQTHNEQAQLLAKATYCTER